MAASANLYKRAICTVDSFNDPEKDDAPAINSALKTCASGTTVLPSNQTFSIQTTLDFSPCRACNVQINGILKFSSDWEFWKTQTAAIHISGTTAAVIDSSNGLLDANHFGWDGQENPQESFPSLFSITDGSYQIHVRNLKIKDVPGTAFHITSGSSAVRLYGVDFLTPALTGYLIEESQHVYVWNNTIRATQACVSIFPNSTNVQVEESTCVVAGASAQSGFELGFQNNKDMSLSWIRNVFVKKVRAIGNMNVVVFNPGSPNGGGQSSPVEITNVTFTDITINGPAKRAVVINEGDNTFRATDISFNSFKGEVEEKSDIRCTKTQDICEFESTDWELNL